MRTPNTCLALVRIAWAALGLVALPQQTRAQYCAYVSSTFSGEVVAVDTGPNRVVSRIAPIPSPGRVAVTRDGRFVYVTAQSQVWVIDTDTNNVVSKIRAGYRYGSCHGVALAPDDRFAYATCDGSADLTVPAGLSVIDNLTRKLITSLTTYPSTEILVTPDGASAYFLGKMSTLFMADLFAMTTRGVGATGPFPSALVLTPDGSRLYVANAADEIVVFDTETHKQLDSIALPPGSRPADLAVTPDGERLYVADTGQYSSAGDVAVIETASGHVLSRFVAGGEKPTGVAITPDGRFVYVALSSSAGISVIDTADDSVAAFIPLFVAPAKITIPSLSGGCPPRTPLSSGTIAPSPTPTATPGAASCTGDCDSSGQVTVDEVLRLVAILLGNEPLSACSGVFGQITVDRVLAAVNDLLNGCR